MATSFKFEMASVIPEDHSTSVGFIGVFDQGRRVTIARRDQKVAYTYEVPSGQSITPVEFNNILKSSLGRFWGRVKQNKLLDKDENFENCTVSSVHWVNIHDKVKSETKKWRITPSVFAF